ncbi:MAG: hypothetical protein AAF439_12390, partial [Pseudomonadota bacterium]
GGWVGGEIVLDVRFVSSDPFKRLRLDLPKIEGARVETLVRPHTLQINMLGGKGYSHAARIAIVPTEAGVLRIPPIRVNGITQQRSGRSFEFTETYEAAEISISPPSPAYGGETWIVSNDVVMEQAWSADIDALSAGDSVRRTVTLKVKGARAENLPPLVQPPGEGYRILSTEVETSTEKTEKGFVANLTESWDLYLDSDEITHFEPVTFVYWDPELADTVVLDVPRQRIEPVLRDATALRDQLREDAIDAHEARQVGVAAMLGIPLVVLLAALAMAVWYMLPTRADRELTRAARRQGPLLGFYGDLLAWRRGTFPAAPRIGQAADGPLGDARPQVDRLNRALFHSMGGEASAPETARALTRVARQRRVSGYFDAILPMISRLLFLR